MTMDDGAHNSWKELLFWTFDGPKYEDHGIDLADLGGLIECRNLVLATAKSLWKRANPGRRRLLRYFDARVQIKFFEVRAGSAVIPICYRVVEVLEDPDMPGIEDPRDIADKVERSAELLVRTIGASGRGEPLPAELPRDVLPRFEQMGGALDEGSSIWLSTPSLPAARMNRDVVRKLAEEAQRDWEDVVEICGEVTMAGLRQDGGVARIRVEGRTVEIRFSPEQEKTITGALHEHERVRLRLRGRGLFGPPGGCLKKVVMVDSLESLDAESAESSPPTESIWQLAEEIRRDVPDGVWDQVPRDGAANLDHYLYGKPR